MVIPISFIVCWGIVPILSVVIFRVGILVALIPMVLGFIFSLTGRKWRGAFAFFAIAILALASIAWIIAALMSADPQIVRGVFAAAVNALIGVSQACFVLRVRKELDATENTS